VSPAPPPLRGPGDDSLGWLIVAFVVMVAIFLQLSQPSFTPPS
jgi:hypothetical protein